MMYVKHFTLSPETSYIRDQSNDLWVVLGCMVIFTLDDCGALEASSLIRDKMTDYDC